MPTTLTECDSTVRDMATAIMQKYHPDLLTADVTISYWFAENKDGQALKLHGYPAAATVKINSYNDRMEGKSDATIKIDREFWDSHDEEEQIALLDHELTHLLVGHDDAGKVITDDANRPKLKMLPHDFSIGGFDAIVKRHGFAAEECQAVLQTRGRWIQNGFNFGDHGDDRHV